MRVKFEEMLRAKGAAPLPTARIVGPVPRAPTNDECVEMFRANGITAANDPKHGLVVRYNGLPWKVAGGDFKHPTLRGLPGVSARSIVWKEPTK